MSGNQTEVGMGWGGTIHLFTSPLYTISPKRGMEARLPLMKSSRNANLVIGWVASPTKKVEAEAEANEGGEGDECITNDNDGRALPPLDSINQTSSNAERDQPRRVDVEENSKLLARKCGEDFLFEGP